MNSKEKIKSTILQKIGMMRKTTLSVCNSFDFSVDDVTDIITAFIAKQVDKEIKNKEAAVFSSRWLFNPQRWGLLLCGGVGTGKTTLAKAIVSTFMELEGGVDRPRVYIANASELAIWQHKDIDAVMRKVAEASMILIDDVGIEPLTVNCYGTEVACFNSVFYKCYEDRKHLIVTSNLSYGDFYRRYGARVADRCNEMCSIYTFRGGSLR